MLYFTRNLEIFKDSNKKFFHVGLRQNSVEDK